jgi:flavin reductase (DIM6/NTAB) family NADH-FMN oxidoreductase RutF
MRNPNLDIGLCRSSRHFLLPKDIVDEFKEVGLTPAPGDLVPLPMVAESPVNLECRLDQILNFGDLPRSNSSVIGEVVQVHVKDEFWSVDTVQSHKLKAIGRLEEHLYCWTTDAFSLKQIFHLE